MSKASKHILNETGAFSTRINQGYGAGAMAIWEAASAHFLLQILTILPKLLKARHYRK